MQQPSPGSRNSRTSSTAHVASGGPSRSGARAGHRRAPGALLRQGWAGRNGYLFILAPLASLVLFFIYPFLRSLWYSLHRFDGRASSWVGLGNYLDLVRDPVFDAAALHTLEFAVKSLVLGVGMALACALLIHSVAAGKGLFRAAFFLPMVSNMVAVSFLWQLLYHRGGLINAALRALGMPTRSWLQDSHTAMNAIVVTSAWQGFGYSMILLLAGLEAIPSEYFEAARIDGANLFQQFWHITLPNLRFVFLFLSITGVSGATQVFTQVQLMTQGGPAHATRTVMFDLYQRFTQLRLGQSNAVGIVIFAVLAVFAIVNLRVLGGGDEP